jgi:hypothetical protein
MRFFTPAAIAATTALMLVGLAGTASATRLCGVNTASTCPAGQIFLTGSGIVAQSTSAVFTTTGGTANPTITCSSQFSQTTTSNGGGAGVAVATTMTGFSLSGCTDTLGVCGASPTSPILGTGSLSWTSGFNGTQAITAGPTVTFSCTIGSSSSCQFIPNGLTGSVTGGHPASIAFTSQTFFGLSGGGCPTRATFTATYATTPGVVPYYLTNS